ncbi:HDIG domain-containing protein [Candidatus Peregrinibacteria bacterium]|nr:HDIG domain-containing protein [Candidatus Peregrinibacteria bacterium]
MPFPLIFVILLVVTVAAAVLAHASLKIRPRINTAEARQQATTILYKAEQECDQIREKTRDQAKRFRDATVEMDRRAQLIEQRAAKTIQLLEERSASKEKEVQQIQNELDQLNQEILKFTTEQEALKKEVTPQLAKVAGTSAETVKNQLLSELAQDLDLARETRLSKLIDYTREHSPVIAKSMLIESIHRYSASTSVEKKNLVIPVNRNETKARLIGQNAEILTLLENELGVDIVFDEGRGGIVVSHFELVKKHIARETILKLIRDRIIDLEKAKKRLEEARAETRAHLIDLGDKVAKKLDLEYRKFPADFKEILGRLKYRTSYGQNILKHCFEVGYFTLLLGNELGLNQEVCKIGGFFHDLGKAIDQEDGRPHDILTKEIMEKFNIFSWEEIHAAWTHHDAIPIETAEALLVKAGDAISAGRPGARQETIEKYLARVMAIEGIANSYEGVNKSYAISGGRELRVLVDPKRLDDTNLSELASTIAKEIEGNVAYPGQIKINVIRRIQHNRTIKEKIKKV